ncbi:MAG TPA: hypothetical protein VF575_02395 [Candidatus Saccharimonadales bacterium]|jgi:hypothetical protein
MTHSFEDYEQQGPYIEVTSHIADLANLGKPREFAMRSARFKSQTDHRISWILLKAVDATRPLRTAIIRFEDDTDFSISLVNGNVESITHTDPAQAKGMDLDRVIPFSGGKRRIDYVSDRHKNEFTHENLADSAVPALVSDESAVKMIDAFIGKVFSEEDRFASSWAKELDPSDIEMDTVVDILMSLRPEDRVDVYPHDLS